MDWQTILDAADDGIVGLDGRGRVTAANRAATALLGLGADQLAGRVFGEAAQLRGPGGDPIQDAADPVASALADGEVRAVTDAICRRADGVDFPVEFTVAPVREPAGVTGAVLIFRDVTERRAIDRARDEFVSVVSHELRTPLTSVRGALGLLTGGLLSDAPPRAQQMLRIAVESTDRLIRLINDILDVERLTAGQLALHRQTRSAAELITSAVAEMRGLAEHAGVHLDVGAAAGHVDADADRVVQTLANLLSNAIRFSPPAGTVRVAAAEQGPEVLFSVSDEGPGIPADQLEAIFERFTQVVSDNRPRQGSGLGLAICRGIVEQHGGRIWARNRPTRGAVIYFTLPLVDVPAEPQLPPDDRAAPTVLVCEDDPQARAVIGELLGSHGYRMIGAATGEQALSLAADQVPAAVLMDLGLPGIDGWATLAALRADERTRDVPMVILSGTEPTPTPTDVTAWLTKPLDVDGLLSTLNDAVNTGGARPCVLVIEDDPALKQVLVAMLTRHDVIAVTASTGQDALRLSHHIAPDLLLLDLFLPDLDGFALVSSLREDPRLRRVPMVVYSALDLDDDDKQRLRLGPTEFLTKARTRPEEVERQVLALLNSVVTSPRR
jgi:PAS domain S-box-containing protein